ncbi:extracellular solute-binding protein [Paenibacillus paeoniae]|uniref:Extracellular solute-binding protein n=1 Tax=Paenibacillus paeoniae TaxID=2292705 RepID=A0A371PG50_9BACL|nr:extracellular solute-binding protein [Paenibacillus paeoniae]REK74943.1 extracellular solute-binding protein [Paenibacillus paeoniae]
MTKARKTTMLIVSAILVLATVLAGCSSDSKNKPSPSPSSNATNTPSNNPEEPASDVWEFGSEALEFSMYGHYSWYDVPAWDSTVAGRWLKENKKLNITPISAGGNPEQKLSTMIASKSLPDVMWMDRGADVERLREAGQLVAFDDYLDKYPNLKTWMGKDLNLLRSSDGKLYQFPNWYTGRANGNAGYVINKKIYDELGQPKLETTDDLYNYLVAVKAKYGDTVVPFDPDLAKDSQGLGVLYTAFKENASYTHLHANVRAVPQGDNLTSLFTDPTFREAQKYIAKLYREKLITQDAFTQTRDQIEERIMQGRVAVYAGANPTVVAMNAHQEMVKKDPESGYFMIWPIHKEGLDKNKIFPGTYTALGWNVNVITKAAKDPEKIFAFLDWYTGPEGQSLLFFGPEGKNWKGFDSEGHPIFTDDYNAEEVLELQKAHDPIMWNGNTGFIDPAKMKYESKLPAHEQNWAARYQSEITWPTQSNATEFINLVPQPDSELGIVKQRVDDIYTQAYAQSVMAKDDAEVESILDKAEKDAQAAGYGELLEWRTVEWKKNIEIIAGG